MAVIRYHLTDASVLGMDNFSESKCATTGIVAIFTGIKYRPWIDNIPPRSKSETIKGKVVIPISNSRKTHIRGGVLRSRKKTAYPINKRTEARNR